MSYQQNIQKLRENPETENIGKKWDDVELNKLLSEVKNKMSFTDIAKSHKRTEGSIRSKLLALALYYINKKEKTIEEASEIVATPIKTINEYIEKLNNKVTKPKSDKTKEPKLKDLTIPQDENEQIEPPKPKPVIKLNFEQQKALETFKKGGNLFLTGPAGTGKSVTLSKIIEFCESKIIRYGVTATTGTAAFLIGGKTLHSYLGIGLGKDSAKDIYEYVRYKLKHTADKLREISVLIIDEISMLEQDLFVKISKYLSLIRRNSKPFGGLQVVLTGDFCQLEPVTGDFCFKNEEWARLCLECVYLHKLVRQDGDIEFQNMLSKLRYGKCTEKIYQKLLSLKNTEFGEVKPTMLYPKNANVDIINKREYDKLIESGAKKAEYKFQCSYLAKNKEKTLKWIKSLDIPDSVELCIGAQVVVLANLNQDAGIVNGTRGVVINLKNKSVIIKRVDNSTYEIEYFKTTNVEDQNLTVSFMPLKLAYALTIHRSQGSTLDAIEIDIGTNIFAAGQAYTALSRAKDLKSIKIKAVAKNSFIVRDEVIEMYELLEKKLKDDTNTYIQNVIDNCIFNILNHSDLEKTINFVRDFIPDDENGEKIDKFFEDYNYKKYSIKLQTHKIIPVSIIKTEEDKINHVINMVNKLKECMLENVEDVIQKIDEYLIILKKP
jgi:ATP-dependent DNA helicase PIF1